MRIKQQVAFRKLFSVPQPTPHQIKSYYVFGTKIFLRRYTEIYRRLLSKYFKNAVLGRQEVVQIFFLTPNSNMSAGKLLKSERFLAVLREHIFFNVKRVEVRKWVRFFARNYIVKWMISFASFCWLWDFLLQNLKLKRNSDDVHWNVWVNIKKLYAQKSQKKNSKYEILNYLYFGPNFVFRGLLQGVLASVFFLIFRRQPTMAFDIFAQHFYYLILH